MIQDQDLVAIQEARAKMECAYAAWQKYRGFSQEQVDAVVESVAAAGRANARKLAEMAVEETGYGNVPDKIAKNLLNADFLPRAMRGMRTIGLLREIPEKKVVEYAVPVGVIAAVVPTTNPTSTAIFKTLVSLKAGNAIVMSPHPRARACTCYTAQLLAQAAVQAGAPEGLVQCLSTVSKESTQELMRHKRTGVILATGGHGLVRAAYASGKPAYGVGPGNVPVLLEKSADVADAVAKVVEGKSFDFGTVCSSEQALVTCREMKDQVLAELRKQNAFLCSPEQAEALGKLLISPEGLVKPECVGQSPQKIARMAGFEVPAEARILAAEIQGVGPEHPLSREKLSPVLALYFGRDFNESMDVCEAILRLGGLGHTCVIFSRDEQRIRQYGARMPANRVLVNTPAPQGSVGLTTNVFPSMTLGCGAAAGNVTSDNVGPQHLYNVRRLAWAVRTADEAFEVPAEAGAPASVRTPTVTNGAPAVPLQTVAATVVDRFLQARAGSRPQAQPASVSCGCPSPEPRPEPKPEPKPEPAIQIMEFVCEQDVREAVEGGRKLFIGAKTIVTPSARELGEARDVLVVAERR